MPDSAAVLDALGDSTRRSVLEQLAPGPAPVGVLAQHLPISRPAVSQHLRILKAAELVSDEVVGTRHLYRVNRAGLQAVHDYLDRFWAATLDNFAVLAAQQAAAETKEASDKTEDRP